MRMLLNILKYLIYYDLNYIFKIFLLNNFLFLKYLQIIIIVNFFINV